MVTSFWQLLCSSFLFNLLYTVVSLLLRECSIFQDNLCLSHSNYRKYTCLNFLIKNNFLIFHTASLGICLRFLHRLLLESLNHAIKTMIDGKYLLITLSKSCFRICIVSLLASFGLREGQRNTVWH